MTVQPRDCFACGQPMVLVRWDSTRLECPACEILEEGTLTGRQVYVLDKDFFWQGRREPYVDHASVRLPSPA